MFLCAHLSQSTGAGVYISSKGRRKEGRKRGGREDRTREEGRKEGGKEGGKEGDGKEARKKRGREGREGDKEDLLHFQKCLQSCKLGQKQGWQI